MKPLQGKVALVTGASRGIGREIARACAAAGARVIVAARSQTPPALGGSIHETVREIEAAGGTARAVRADVSRPAEVQALLAATRETFGRLDILVNNAATNRPAPFVDMPAAVWDRILAVNLRGAVLCIRAALPALQEAGGGHIINLCSVVARNLHHRPFTGIAYDISKLALERLTLGLAEELRPCRIAVNGLMPDNTATEGWAYLNPEVDRDAWQRPEVWGEHAAWVAAQDCASFTGHILTHADFPPA